MSRSRSIFVFSCPQTCLLCSILSSVSPGWRGPRGVWCYSLCFRTSGTNCPRLCRQTLNCPSLSPLALNFCPQARLSTTGGRWESKSKRKTRVWKISFISVSDVTDAFHIRILNVILMILIIFSWFRHYHVYFSAPWDVQFLNFSRRCVTVLSFSILIFCFKCHTCDIKPFQLYIN